MYAVEGFVALLQPPLLPPFLLFDLISNTGIQAGRFCASDAQYPALVWQAFFQVIPYACCVFDDRLQPPWLKLENAGAKAEGLQSNVCMYV